MEERPDLIGKQVDLLCAECGRPNAHTVLAAYDSFWKDGEVNGGATHEFLRCNGCLNGTYRATSWFSEEDGRVVVLHPPRGGNTRKERQWEEVPWKGPLRKVYTQTVATFNAGAFTLAGAGVRLLIEGICIDQNVTDGPKLDSSGKQLIDKKSGKPIRRDNLEGKINGLAEKSFISARQANNLHEVRFLGNDAAHQLDLPTPDVVGHALDIVEHLMDQVYEQPAKAKALASRKRPGKP